MIVEQTPLADLLLIKPDVFGDHRGFFLETWSAQRYQEQGIKEDFVQDNLSLSQQGVLRGLHFQNPNAQGKLVSVLAGAVFDVAVDIRQGSPTFGQWFGVELTAENHFQLYVPAGFAHGFCVMSEQALFAYKCTAYYDPSAEHSLLWNDPAIGIEWPVKNPQLSKKDLVGKCLKEFDEAVLPLYGACL